MREFTLPAQKRVRVWLGDLPDASFVAIKFVEDILLTSTAVKCGARAAAVELFAHTGGYCPYGLLGAYFVPEKTATLCIRVAVSSAEEHVFAKALAGNLDQVRVGLPSEYVAAVVEGARTSHALFSLGTGTIQFNRAAHGQIGSSPHTFQRLAQLVVALLYLDPATASQGEIMNMLDKAFD